MLRTGRLGVRDPATGPVRGGRGANGVMKFEYLKLTMPGLAELLTPHVDRPVVDMTNLKGSYYLASVNRPSFGSAQSANKTSGTPDGGGDVPLPRKEDPYGAGLLIAIEKAGLKLEARKAPVEVIVVDHLEKTPTAN